MRDAFRYNNEAVCFIIDPATPNAVSIGKGDNPTAKLDVSGSVKITGSLNVSSGITGSLLGTASFASSFPPILQFGDNRILTSDGTANGINAEFLLLWDGNTFDVWGNQLVRGTGSFQNNVQISGSLRITGSQNIVGNSNITGSLNVSQGVTASLFGTSSWALNVVGGATSFPFTGSANITGSLNVVGPTTITGPFRS